MGRVFRIVLLTPGRTSGPAYAVGVLFLAGGIANVYMLPSPVWFSTLDLVMAYVPMAWLAHRVAWKWVAEKK